jgi:hypothetical protein
MADKHPAFAVHPQDSKDVSWALATADTCWKRGERAEALRWLRRAVESASEAEQDERALELAKAAADLATHIGSVAPPQAPGARAVGIPRAGGLPALSPAKPMAALTARAPQPKDPPKKADRKSITNEAAKARVPQPPQVSKPAEKPALKPTELPAAPRKRAGSKVDRGEVSHRLSRTEEIDEWPTDVVPGDELPPHVAPPVPSARPVTTVQALRVLVWRTPDGSVHVEPAGKGAKTPALAVEATLVASDIATNLVGLFGKG